jgi:spore cortex formation protein SpoVR/YcgB (stage V sporulation)
MIREFGLFHVLDDAGEQHLRVQAIHDERGYRKIQRALARQYDVAYTMPDIQVVDVNLEGDRKLILHHRTLNRVLLEEKDTKLVLQHVADMWGYDVVLKEIDPGNEAVLKEHAATPRPGILPTIGDA